MSTKVFCLIIILSAAFATKTGTCLVSALQEQVNHSDKQRDFDEVRISSNQWPMNYHSIGPGVELPPHRKISEQVTNHIGKPLVQLPEQPRQEEQQQQQQQSNADRRDSSSRKPRYPTPGASTSLAERFQLRANEPKPNGRQQLKLAKSSSRQLTPHGSCRWISLREFKNISLDTNELIIRDAGDQPCYIFSLKAYIVSNDGYFLPFSNLKAHPQGSTIEFDDPSDGASVRLPLNCSSNANADIKSGGSGGGGSATSLYLTRLPDRSFKEEIIIISECGYLILSLRGKGSYLSLERLSFYLNADIISQTNDERSRSSRIKSSRTMPQIRPELLVFSSEDIQRQANSSSPLFTMPLISRYICQNRVILTDKNSTRLVLDRFELKRLSFPSLSSSPSKESPVTWFGDTTNQHPLDDASLMVLGESPEGATARAQHDTTNPQRIPLSLAQLASVAGTDISCPNPTSPLVPLNSMMEFTQDHGSDLRVKRFRADKWATSVPASATSYRFQGIGGNGWYIDYFYYILITILLRFIIVE